MNLRGCLVRRVIAFGLRLVYVQRTGRFSGW